MEFKNYLRVINDNGVTKVYFCIDENEEPMCMHELKNGEAVKIIIGENGGLASINEKRL